MSCGFDGNSDMYGLGIRVGFYLQWYGTIAATWVAKSEVKGMRLSNSFFISATFLALIIQTSMNALRPVEIYIILLLTYGAYYSLVPLYLWRLVTGCNPFWDPSRWSRVKAGRVYSILNFGLLVAETSFQLWFWCTGIHTIPVTTPCRQHGFFFGMVSLTNPLFIAANIAFNVVLLICCFVHMCLGVKAVRPPRWHRKQLRRAEKRQLSKERLLGLQLLQTVFNLIVASLVVVATELTVRWNDINEVNDVSTAGQIIPVVISAGLFAHLFYIYSFKREGDASDPRLPDPRSPNPRPSNPWRPDPIDSFPPIMGAAPAPTHLL
ncbi:hypothetical protein F4804DRAFT_300839 [Jackrogersella minutella]|nr:hypothetical protein F4804DRAFT_300839 [Jackrogersella minutella]